MIKNPKISNKLIPNFNFGFRICADRFVSDFELRISDFASVYDVMTAEKCT